MTTELLNSIQNMEITHQEAMSVLQSVLASGITGIIIVYMIMAFGKGLGLRKKEREEFVEMAKEL